MPTVVPKNRGERTHKEIEHWLKQPYPRHCHPCLVTSRKREDNLYIYVQCGCLTYIVGALISAATNWRAGSSFTAPLFLSAASSFHATLGPSLETFVLLPDSIRCSKTIFRPWPVAYRSPASKSGHDAVNNDISTWRLRVEEAPLHRARYPGNWHQISPSNVKQISRPDSLCDTETQAPKMGRWGGSHGPECSVMERQSDSDSCCESGG